LLVQLASVCKDFPGSWVEDKGLTLSVHFRQLEEAQHDALRDNVFNVCQPHVTTGNIVVRTGKKVLEVRPAVNWHKGSATRWLAAYWALPGSPQILSAGDDFTDEDLFAAWPGECHIRVGPVADSLAPWYLAHQSEIPQLLRDVLACLAEFTK
jgi:trehalose-phosphatase